MSFHSPELMSAGASAVVTPDGSHRIPVELWADYAQIVLLEPEPNCLADWVRQLEDALGVTDAHREAIAAAEQERTWYLLRVQWNRERSVMKALTEEAKVRAYVPIHVSHPEGNRRKAPRKRALIPGYVFANLPDDDAIDGARAMRGVVEILCQTDGSLRRVPPLAIGSLVLAEACHQFDETWEPPAIKGKRYSYRWRKGEKVMIRSGPFAGFEAEVQRGQHRDHMAVLLQLFGRITEVVVEHRDLEKPE